MNIKFGILVITLLTTLSASQAFAQCELPQGNAQLDVGGLPQIGGHLNVSLSGRPLAPFILGVSSSIGSLDLLGSTVCLGSDLAILMNGITDVTGYSQASPFFLIPGSGVFQTDLSSPDDPSLVDLDFHFQGFTLDSSAPNGFVAISNLESLSIEAPQQVETVFFEDWEAGFGSWFVTSGSWQVGEPTSGPLAAFSGPNCAGTVLDSNYPPGVLTHLVSPLIGLPLLGPGEELRLNYRVWFSLAGGDSVQLQVSTDNGASWTDPPCGNALTATGTSWTQASMNLSSYAGQFIRLGVRLWTDGGSTSSGAFLDDLHIFRGTPFLSSPEDFEDGIGDWWTVTKGTWEVGVPTSGPAVVPSGTQCAGTRLDGNYPAGASSCLVSAPVQIPNGPFPTLLMKHWFSFAGGDAGRVEVSQDNGCTWTVLDSVVGTSGGVWTPLAVDLSDYAGQTVRLCFRLSSDGGSVSSGWYIDDVRFE